MLGQDVDCTAAPILNALAIMIDFYGIDQQKYVQPIGDTIYTMMRKMQKFTIEELCDKTVKAIRNACQKRRE